MTAAFVAAPLLAQTPAPQPQESASGAPADSVAKAREQIRSNAAALDKVPLEMAVEPSFAFKP